MTETKTNWKARVAAAVVITVVTLVGVVLLLKPATQMDRVEGPIVPPFIGLLAYVVLSIALYDWMARQVGDPYKAALMLAASQFVLVNVDFVLSGKRGLLTAGASTVMMIATWGGVAFVYSYFARRA